MATTLPIDLEECVLMLSSDAVRDPLLVREVEGLSSGLASVAPATVFPTGVVVTPSSVRIAEEEPSPLDVDVDGVGREGVVDSDCCCVDPLSVVDCVGPDTSLVWLEVPEPGSIMTVPGPLPSFLSTGAVKRYHCPSSIHICILICQ